MIYLIIFIIGLIIGWTIGKIIPQEINFPLFIKKILAYFPCRSVWYIYKYKIDPGYYYKIYAIKKYREITNEGLKESKEQIERWFE